MNCYYDVVTAKKFNEVYNDLKQYQVAFENLEKAYESLEDEHKEVIQAYDEMCDYAGDLEDRLEEYESEEDTCECCGECCCNSDEEVCPYIDDVIDEVVDTYEETICPYCEFRAPVIKNIYYCDKPGKEKVIVIFDDDTKVIKEMVQGDYFDLNVGVALCIAEKLYGSKSKFHKTVKKIAGITEKRNKIIETPKN